VVAAILVLAAAAALSAGLRPLSKLGSRRSRELSRASMQFASGINEAVRLAEETHVFGAEQAQREREEALQAEVSVPFYYTNMLARLVPGIYQSLIYLLVLMALAGLYFVGSGRVTALGAVVLLLVRAGAYGQQGQAAFQALRQCLPFIERLQQAQQRYLTTSPPTGSERLEDVRELSLDSVSYAYDPGRPVLSGVSFAVTGGETIGIIGPSGAGKSTLVQILLGLRAPDVGRYEINGILAEQFRREDWHSRIAYVPQEPRLLHGTVAENIRFFRSIEDVAVERAARLAGIHDDVMSWSAGYETTIGPRADAVSGGQQQRICLARALAAEPQILVLDEPTSALDPHAEALIQQSLRGLKGRLTLFVVAHRMSTLDICERVMVIVDGQMEAFEPLGDLMHKSPYYSSASSKRNGTADGNGGGRHALDDLRRLEQPSGLLAAVRSRIGGTR
jgi:ABC-type multidrug transport system fused ATPase/permease subunit